jgi:hypothetical protein
MAKFKEAFRTARAAGKKEFTWNSKKYNTKLKTDTPSKVPTPSPAPRSTKKTESKTPKAGVSGATRGFGVGEKKRQAAFDASNKKSNEYRKGLLGKSKK